MHLSSSLNMDKELLESENHSSSRYVLGNLIVARSSTFVNHFQKLREGSLCSF